MLISRPVNSGFVTQKGFADGFVVKYNTTTSVTITAGVFEANGVKYTLLADTTHTLTSLVSAFDLNYILLDTSASTPNNPVFIDTITESAFDDVKRGEYIGDDRVVGVISSHIGTATIVYFETIVINGSHIQNFICRTDSPLLASAQTPDATWQIPNVNESDVLIPVNAIELYLQIGGTDLASSQMVVGGASKEWSIANVAFASGPLLGFGNGRVSIQRWIPLGVSRQIRISGEADDDPALTAFVNGYGYRR